MLFDIKATRYELTQDGLYVEYSPLNEELIPFIKYGNTYELINSSITETINANISSVREELYNNLPEEYKSLYRNARFKITGKIDDPTNIDYDVFGLHKKRTIIFGELREVEYFRNYDPLTNTYSDLVVEEYRDYTRDVNGLVQYRNQTSVWILDDETTGTTKTTVKHYNLTESIQEGLERRGNIIAQTKAYCLGVIGQLYSFDLLTSVKNEIQLFIDGYTQPLRDAINNSTKPYLNQTIKDNIIENLRLT